MEIKKFAWYPQQVTSGTWIWLKPYYQHSMFYDPSTGRPPLFSLQYTWTETETERTWRLLTTKKLERQL